MEPADLDTYGGEKVDRTAAQNRETDVSADDINALAEHSAQMTRTSMKAIVAFTTVSAGAPQVAVASWWSTQWGRGVAQKPTIAKTDQGIYVITFPTTFADGLGNTETLAFQDGAVEAWSTDEDDLVFARKYGVTANTISVCTFVETAGTIGRGDVGNSSTAVFPVTVRIYG